MSRTMSFYDLRDAMAEPGCAVCRMKARAGDQFLDSLLWESVNDPDVRREIRQAGGFCHRHSWSLARQGASLGLAIIMHDLLRTLLEATEDAHYRPGRALSLRRAQEKRDPAQPTAATAELVSRLTPEMLCPACVQVEKMESLYLQALLENLLSEDNLLAAYRASEGLCLAHYRQALARVRDKATFEALISTQRAIWGRLFNQLSEVIRKSDYRFQDEIPGEERGATLRAVAALSGPSSDYGN